MLGSVYPRNALQMLVLHTQSLHSVCIQKGCIGNADFMYTEPAFSMDIEISYYYYSIINNGYEKMSCIIIGNIIIEILYKMVDQQVQTLSHFMKCLLLYKMKS